MNINQSNHIYITEWKVESLTTITTLQLSIIDTDIFITFNTMWLIKISKCHSSIIIYHNEAFI